jgi:hypothetical protein
MAARKNAIIETNNNAIEKDISESDDATHLGLNGILLSRERSKLREALRGCFCGKK